MVDLQVTMVEADAAKHAISDPNPVIDGRKANVNLAYLGAKPRTTVSAGRPNPPDNSKLQTTACPAVQTWYPKALWPFPIHQ